MSKNDDKVTAVGCVIVALWGLFSIAWVGFLVWAIYTLVTWLVTK